tara:strand:- start:1006 stop:1341 length:336 start_codon:yes stop_codon:yes gene_type:complete
MHSRIVAIKSVPEEGVACRIVYKDGRVVDLMESTRDSRGTDANSRKAEKSVRNEFRKGTSDPVEKSEIHVHKNRDGTYSYAFGAEPTVWPEDEPGRDDYPPKPVRVERRPR